MDKLSRREFLTNFPKKTEKKAGSRIDDKDLSQVSDERKISRRDFLKLTGATAGSLALNQIGIKSTEAAEKVKDKRVEQNEKIKIDWEKFIYGFCQENPRQVEKLGDILKNIWGDDFNSGIGFYKEKEGDSAFGFLTAGHYSYESNSIEFNTEFTKSINNSERAYKFLDVIFHEAGHADIWKRPYSFLENLANKLETDDFSTYDIIRHSKILKEEKIKEINGIVFSSRLINEVCASFGEVYASFKVADKYEFPLADFLAKHSLFNKINQKDIEEKKKFFYKNNFNSSIYSSVEFFAVLLIEDFNFDLEKLRKFLKENDPRDISLKVNDLYVKFENKKNNKLGLDAKNIIPGDLYRKIRGGDVNLAEKEEEVYRDYFIGFSRDLKEKTGVEINAMEREIENIQKKGRFKNFSVHVFDEIIFMEEGFEKNPREVLEGISYHEEELLKIVKDLYLMFLFGGEQPEIKAKVDSTIQELEYFLIDDSFSDYRDRIEEEIRNINEIYAKMFKGSGFKKR